MPTGNPAVWQRVRQGPSPAPPVLDLLQWPAMAITIVAAWLVASARTRRRAAGFALFLVSNALWITWGWHDAAWALVALQSVLIVTNVRGIADNRAADGAAHRKADGAEADGG